MTDSYLRSLGFAAVSTTRGANQPTFRQAWRYQHEVATQDGTRLFIEHPLGIEGCRLSSLAAPLARQDVFATVALHDEPGLEAAIENFYAAHGGRGAVAAPVATSAYLPYRRQQ
ncbi:hypothetical protein MUN84_03010 [Hymenobacter sp. 5516J-16]|uniref:hypothetical protein n=1 Tax=Hymenobacter sp. 5516J-16 TaxID=2932253 RepID=UPI001FD52A08|nr:hypothetical protein [Hymenobacter sp. 5516J-16]UOQ77663.1 hypothetical protein MUN84_03010 [Hymenobacter sp. 5516J-16]